MHSEQKTEEWLLERLGHITGSRFDDVIAVGKRDGKPLASRKTAITEITLEILTNSPGPMWTSKATDWGKAHEPAARMAYEVRTGALCEVVGFIRHRKHPRIGCSPDGLIDHDGGWETKCPFNASVHLDTLLNGMPQGHMAQVQGGMFCTGREWWDFVSYHPMFPPEMQLYIERIYRNDAYIKDMEDRLLDAVGEIDDNVTRLLARYCGAVRLEAA